MLCSSLLPRRFADSWSSILRWRESQAAVEGVFVNCVLINYCPYCQSHICFESSVYIILVIGIYMYLLTYNDMNQLQNMLYKNNCISGSFCVHFIHMIANIVIYELEI